MKLADLVIEILKVAEKAACLARTIRAEKTLFQLLVQEKTGEEKNKRFVEDFKTLTDVLVQETVCHDLGQKFPLLSPNIHGEESNKFTNILGETVTVAVQASSAETSRLLAKVLDGNERAASLLSELVHRDTDVPGSPAIQKLGDIDIPEDSIGIWIDPIDSTAQYIRGVNSERHPTGVCLQGLQSVLVLIGVYSLKTGEPLLGVLNQPFSTQTGDNKEWRGDHIWGISHGDLRVHSLQSTNQSPDKTADRQRHLVMSSSEPPAVEEVLRREGYTAVPAAGGGYKLQCVLQGLVGGFVLTRGSTYKWDTCAPHAVLRALGGGVVDFRKAFDTIAHCRDDDDAVPAMLERCQLVYNVPDRDGAPSGETWSNSGGLIAYIDLNIVVDVIKTLNSSEDFSLE